MDQPSPVNGPGHVRELSRRRLPFGVIAIAGLQVVNVVLVSRSLSIPDRALDQFWTGFERFELLGAALAIVGAIAAVGLVLRHRWGWTATMLWAGTTLAVELIAYREGEASHPTMAIGVAIVFYLNLRDVRLAFGQLDDVPKGWEIDRA